MILPNRKTMRLPDYDYNQNGAYFITICTKNREPLLSRVYDGNTVDVRDVGDAIPYGTNVKTNDNNVGTDVLGCPSAKIILHKHGIVVKKYLEQMKDFYNNVFIDKYVIMPDHIHFILRIEGFENDNSNKYSTVSNFVSTFKRFCNKEYGENVFQRSFFDHVIRNEQDYIETWNYIDNNPLNWLLKYSPNLN